MKTIVKYVIVAIIFYALATMLFSCATCRASFGDMIVVKERPLDTVMVVGGKYEGKDFNLLVRYTRKNGTWYEYKVNPIKEEILIVNK